MGYEDLKRAVTAPSASREIGTKQAHGMVAFKKTTSKLGSEWKQLGSDHTVCVLRKRRNHMWGGAEDTEVANHR